MQCIVIPTAPELTHGGRDGSCYANLDVSTLNDTSIWKEHPGSSQCLLIATRRGYNAWNIRCLLTQSTTVSVHKFGNRGYDDDAVVLGLMCNSDIKRAVCTK